MSERLLQDAPVARTAQHLLADFVPVCIHFPNTIYSFLEFRGRIVGQAPRDELLAVRHISHGLLPASHLQVVLIESRREPHCQRDISYQ